MNLYAIFEIGKVSYFYICIKIFKIHSHILFLHAFKFKMLSKFFKNAKIYELFYSLKFIKTFLFVFKF